MSTLNYSDILNSLSVNHVNTTSIMPSIITAITAIVATYLVDTNTVWYQTLIKPSFNPSPIIFSIAWTIIYILIAFVGFFDWNIPGMKFIFILQALLNVAWVYVFFQMQNPKLAFVIIILQIVIVTIWMTKSTRKWLLVPYLAWLLFAAFINYKIMVDNPSTEIIEETMSPFIPI